MSTYLDTKVITNSQLLPRLKCCFGYEAKNIGAVACRVNGRLLNPPPGAGLDGTIVNFTDPLRQELTDDFLIEFFPGAGQALELTQAISV